MYYRDMKDLKLKSADIQYEKSSFLQIIRSAQILENCGCSTIVIACMTAHNYYEDILNSRNLYSNILC